ncbi:MAG: hypothetical protein IJP25_07080 [Elusimicrobiaceae bacterium]|uniref:DUF3307 domain-containing protein n=1 Tax=Candidatus Avelusimicrobium gallicola TaxID=2562704 RepID=A0A928HIU7_9BACT|nr:hypothetical protein [Elusimicrobium sp.]MBQ9971862.1 hypothetical protein [Elusimicrobiaceae bacterium]
MIVFWRLFLAFFLTDFVVFNRMAEKLRARSRALGMLLHGGVFLLLCLGLCYGYLSMQWPFLDLVHMPGWVCIILLTLFHVFSDEFFQFGGKSRHGYLMTFFVKNLANFLFIFLCVPFKVLYETGNFFAEPWVIFCVGLVSCTRMLGWFSFAIEQDRYGRDYPTFDERWLLSMMRMIFFLIMLLPGWRWVVLLTVWFMACLYARRIRLMDISHAAFYIGIIGSVVIGFLVRLRFYLVG